MDFSHFGRYTAQWSPRVFMALALVWLASVLAHWTWSLIPSPPAPPVAPLVEQSGAQNAPRRAESINAAALWGRAAPVETARTQDTRLPLALRGVLTGAELALISASGQPERVYRVGAALPGGARLHAVREDHVLIERAGVIERLALPKQGLEPSAPDRSAAAPADGLSHLLRGGSMAELSRSFRIEPVVEGGSLLGYRLRALRDPAMLQALGLEPDDILVSVNGRPLAQANDLPGLIKDLREADGLDAVVLRNGVETPLRVDLNG
ncbi:MAG: type II secretion system protein N [Pseudomonadota bacterium]